MNRRTFIAQSSTAALAATLAPSAWALAPNNPYRKNIGIQLYTLRKAIGKDTKATLKAVADAGYKQVEAFRYPNAGDMIKAAKDYGMAVNSSHFAWEAVTNPNKKGVPAFDAILDQAKKDGLSHLVIPYLHEHERAGGLDAYKRLADLFNAAAAKAQTAGIQLAYHNHAFEFKPEANGTSGYDVLLSRCAPEMKFEIDVFWVKVAALDPVSLMKKMAGRVSQLHLKDLAKEVKLPSYPGVPPEAFKELGNGQIAMEPIIKAATAAGVAHCHVEQDHSPDPLKSVQDSMAYLQSL